MRPAHDCAFAMAQRLADIVAGALSAETVANLRKEFYHVVKAGLEQYLEAARLERRRLDPTGKGE